MIGISAQFLNIVCSDERTMSPPNLVQIDRRSLQNTYVVLGAPLKTDEKAVVNHQ